MTFPKVGCGGLRPLHAAWNFNRFSLGVIRIDSPEERIPEYISFNLLEGSDSICFLAAVLTIMTSVWYRKKRLS